MMAFSNDFKIGPLSPDDAWNFYLLLDNVFQCHWLREVSRQSMLSSVNDDVIEDITDHCRSNQKL